MTYQHQNLSCTYNLFCLLVSFRELCTRFIYFKFYYFLGKNTRSWNETCFDLLNIFTCAQKST
jgi:hypothetical protein